MKIFGGRSQATARRPQKKIPGPEESDEELVGKSE
jgi:hypothetical protein